MTSIPQKTCPRCQRPKPLSDFCNNARRKDGLNSACRACVAIDSKESRERHPPRYISGTQKLKRRLEKGLPGAEEARIKERERSVARIAQRRRNNAEWVRSFKIHHGCADCGYNTEPHLLQFDHLPGTVKTANVSALVSENRSLKKIQAEVAKCEVVCAACHKIRTLARQA
jgi:hypothetical protein